MISSFKVSVVISAVISIVVRTVSVVEAIPEVVIVSLEGISTV